MHPLIEQNIEKIQQLGQKHYLKSLFVFGSVANGDFNDGSDVDFLHQIDYQSFDFDHLETMPYNPNTEFYELKNELEKLLKRKVDLIANQKFRNKYFQQSVEKSKFLIFSNERFTKISG